MEVSRSAIRILAQLLETRTGQQLAPGRHWLLGTALKALMRERGIATLDGLVAAIVSGREPELSDAVVDALLNKETFFFRDRGTFDSLLGGALPRLVAARESEKRLRIWCAGCSTGQEAYSIAIALAEQQQRLKDWRIDILATDVSPAAVARAREGTYSQFEVQRGLPVVQMIRWFEEAGGQRWRIADRIRTAVRFQVHNLLSPPPGLPGWDIILCRNVLLYFPEARRRAVFATLADAAAPDACLMLGAGETIIGQTDAFIPDAAQRGLYLRAPPEPLGLPKRVRG